MNYRQLIDKMGVLLDSLDEFVADVGDDRDAIDENPSERILQDPATIWQSVINELQGIVDKCREKDA